MKDNIIKKNISYKNIKSSFLFNDKFKKKQIIKFNNNSKLQKKHISTVEDVKISLLV